MVTHNSKGPVRIERDSLGDVKVPLNALYGAQTQRAVDNFPISGIPMPRAFLWALGQIKAACAVVSGEQGRLPQAQADAICAAALAVAQGTHDDQFPVDLFQTGSGTSSNMNANEVIAAIASASLGEVIHPNDHVNLGQSSNDVVPSAIHLAAANQLQQALLPAIEHLNGALEMRIPEWQNTVKTGRTHLMDAMPVTFAQEAGGWLCQLQQAKERLQTCQPRLHQLALGGTAVGTGVNAPPEMAAAVCRQLSKATGIPCRSADNFFAALSSQDTAVELSGQLRGLAVVLIKICNDLRMANSGPLAGLGEVRLPQLQPGSSIMPGKVNPVVPEAVLMACYQVVGYDTAITLAGQSGNFQLNVALPLVAYNLLQSIHLLANSLRLLADKAIAGLEVDCDRALQSLSLNPILITALNPVIGYELGAKIAKQAYAQRRPVIDVALEFTNLDEAELRRLLDPLLLTRPQS